MYKNVFILSLSLKRLLNSLVLFLSFWVGTNHNLLAQKVNHRHLVAVDIDVTLRTITQQLFDVTFSLDISRLRQSTRPDSVMIICELQNTAGNTTDRDTFYIEKMNAKQVNQRWTATIRLEPAEPVGTLVFTAIDIHTRKQSSKRMPYNLTAKNDEDFIVLRNLTATPAKQYAKTTDTLLFFSNKAQTVYIYRFNHTFLPALPPMQTENINTSPDMQTDTLLIVTTNQPFVLNKTALYFAQLDTTTREGVPITIVSPDFPKYRKIDNIIQALAYISSQKEMLALKNNSDKKKSLDTYLLSISTGVDSAKQLIKKYFERVTYANDKFTSYKEGWKTDQGIIYIVFGAPEQIIKQPDREEWIYKKQKNKPEIVFEFYKVSNLFCKNCYELNRKNTYRDIWYDVVDEWRSGK
jgi:GWxTD domain-containing protein